MNMGINMQHKLDESSIFKKNCKMLRTIFEDPGLAKLILGRKIK
jgi:hypothetical protein